MQSWLPPTSGSGGSDNVLSTDQTLMKALQSLLSPQAWCCALPSMWLHCSMLCSDCQVRLYCTIHVRRSLHIICIFLWAACSLYASFCTSIALYGAGAHALAKHLLAASAWTCGKMPSTFLPHLQMHDVPAAACVEPPLYSEYRRSTAETDSGLS